MPTKPRIQAGYGLTDALPHLASLPIVAVRNPTARDRAELGTIWVNRTTNGWWILTSVIANVATWTQAVNGAGIFVALTATAGDITANIGNIVATLGNITCAAGTIQALAGQVTAALGFVGAAGGITTVGNVSLTGGNVTIASDAAAHAVVIGSVTAAASTTIRSGTGDLALTSTDAITLDAVGVLELNSSAGVIGIGNDAIAQAINIGTGAAARTITIGNATLASSVVVNVGTGNADFGVNATDHTSRIGSTNGVSATTVQAGTGALTLTAGGALDANVTGAATLDAASISLDATTASNLTVTGAGQDLTLSSVLGSVAVSASEASATAISITASDAAAGIGVTAGTAGVNVTASYLSLNGIFIYAQPFGGGAPTAGLAVHIGDILIDTTSNSAVTRMYIASAPNTWVNVSMSA